MIIKCKMCGGDLNIQDGNRICECEFCGTQQTVPQIDDAKKANLFNRANRLRINAEFDKAATVYASITAEFPEEAEAYWGLCLCKYGIEYVDDPLTGNKIPTCHRTLTTSILDDSDFDQACENADSDSKKLYREEAKAIDRIQQDILTIVANEKPFDVFICYKETNEEGDRTEDSVIAQEIYDFLSEKGLKVFFARITLEDKLGKQYEPYIYAALHSAKVMLAVGTQYEYFDSVWVKNEWARYLDMMKVDKSKTLIPCYKGIDAYDMPREFKNLQALDMGKIGWKQDLVRGIKKLTSADEQEAQSNSHGYMIAGTNVDNLMKRAYLFMEDGNFENANEYLNKVLDANAEYAPAYIAKVCTALGFHREDDLGKADQFFTDNADWKKALRFATTEQKKKYDGYVAEVLMHIIKYDLPDFETIEQCKMSIKALEPYKEHEGVLELIDLLDQNQRSIEAYIQRLATANMKIEELVKKYEKEDETFRTTIDEINTVQQRKMMKLRQQKDEIEDSIRKLMREELSITGLFTSKKKEEIAERRRNKALIRDELESQYHEEEKKLNEMIKSTEQEKPDKTELNYNIARIYLDNELYEEAVLALYKIIDYKDARVLIDNNQNLWNALEKLENDELRFTSNERKKIFRKILDEPIEETKHGYECKSVDDFLLEIFANSIALLSPDEKQEKILKILNRTFPIVDKGYKPLDVRDLIQYACTKLFNDSIKEEFLFLEELHSICSMVEVWLKWRQYGLGRKYHDINTVIANYKEQERISGHITNIENKKNEIFNMLKSQI